MEKVQSRNVTKPEIIMPFGLNSKQIEQQWELVYFLSPFCDGTCAHCWSRDVFMGKPMPIRWHKKFWSKINPDRLREIKLTGGEPLLYSGLRDLIGFLRNKLGAIPIRIFTSGRNLVSLKAGERGITETVSKIMQFGLAENKVEIHLSADEHHAGSLYRKILGIKIVPSDLAEIRAMNNLGETLLQTQVRNFLAACERIKEKKFSGFGGGFLKVHAESGRLDYHRHKIFSWIKEGIWENNVIASEGLISAGGAKELEGSKEITSSGVLSLLVFPGAEFHNQAITKMAQAYRHELSQGYYYLDYPSQKEKGAFIVGWWNVINRTYCGGNGDEIAQLIGY